MRSFHHTPVLLVAISSATINWTLTAYRSNARDNPYAISKEMTTIPRLGDSFRSTNELVIVLSTHVHGSYDIRSLAHCSHSNSIHF